MIPIQVKMTHAGRHTAFPNNHLTWRLPRRIRGGFLQTFATPPAVLITDDDPAWREALEQVFGPPQYRPLLASDGCEAVEIVRQQRIDLVLLDMHMPRLNGLETIRRVRELHAEMPCILISGALDERIRQDALAVRAYSVLAKPIRLGEVRRVVQQALLAVYGWPRSCQDDSGDDAQQR